MAKKNRRKRRSITIPENLVSLLAAVATALCCFWRVGLTRLYQDAGSAYYSVALEYFLLLFVPAGAALFWVTSSMTAARVERGSVKGARMVVRTALLCSVAGSLILGLAGFLCCDLFADGLMGLPLVRLAIQGFLPALLPVCVFLGLAGGMDGFGSTKSVGMLRLAFCLLLFFAGPVFAAPLYERGKMVGALLQNEQFGPAHGAMGGAFAFGTAAAFTMLVSLALWWKLRPVLLNMERGEAFVYERQGQVFGVIVKRMLIAMLPVLILTGGLIGENLIFFRMAEEEAAADSLTLWGLYAGKGRALLEVPLIWAAIFAAHMLPDLRTGSLIRNQKRAREKCMVFLRCMALILIPAAVYLAVLAGPVTKAFFPDGDVEQISAILRIGSVSVVLFGMALAFAVFLAAGQMTMTATCCVLVCTLLQLLTLSALMKVPGMGIYAVLCANLIYAILLFAVFGFIVQKRMRIRVNWVRVFLAPCVGGIALALVCALFGLVILKKAPDAVNAIVCALVGFCVYFVVVVILKGATKRELSCFGGGEALIAVAGMLHIL